MDKRKFTKRDFKKLLGHETMCRIQHNGWTCGTCFFSLSNDLDNKDWQALLFYREGFIDKESYNNLPEDVNKSLNKIWDIINKEDLKGDGLRNDNR